MYKKICLLLLAYLPLLMPLEAGLMNIFTPAKEEKETTPPMIKVLLLSDKPGTIIEVKGRYKIYDPHTDDFVSTRFTGKRKFMQALQDGLKWGEEFPGVHQLIIVPDSPMTTVVVDGTEYQGAIYIYGIEGMIAVVNQIYIEDYLRSILATKYKDALSEETLAAIAIAARTNAYYQSKNSKSPYWDVDGKQVHYNGYSVSGNKSPIENAIIATRYLVLTQYSGTDSAAVPFTVQWGSPKDVEEAEALSEKGQHAAQILAKAYPNAAIALMRTYGSTKPLVSLR